MRKQETYLAFFGSTNYPGKPLSIWQTVSSVHGSTTNMTSMMTLIVAHHSYYWYAQLKSSLGFLNSSVLKLEEEQGCNVQQIKISFSLRKSI
jgi:hypothetical protein